MNPLDLTYCETHSWAHMAQPWNTISNGVFFLVAFVLLAQIYRTDAAKDKSLVWLIASITLIGACSTFWHATQYPWALIVDVSGIIVFAIYYIYYVGRKRLSLSWGKSTLVLAGVIGACVVAMKLTDAHMVQRSGAFIPLSLLFFCAAVKLWQTARIDALYFIGAGATMALAIVARVLDVSVCPHMPMGTHFLWHSLTAVTTYCLMIPVINAYRRR